MQFSLDIQISVKLMCAFYGAGLFGDQKVIFMVDRWREYRMGSSKKEV